MTLLFLYTIFIYFIYTLYKRSFSTPSIPLSHVSTTPRSTYRIIIEKNRIYLPCIALILLLIAPYIQTFTSTALPENISKVPAIFFSIDQSSSMSEMYNQRTQQSKLQAAKEISKTIIDTYPESAYGLMAFARRAQIFTPITKNKSAILSTLNKLSSIVDTKADGSAIGYALFKMVLAFNSIREQFHINNTPITAPTIILFTDGIEHPHPEDIHDEYRSLTLAQAIEYAMTENIRVYIVALEQALTAKKFEPDRKNLEATCQKTGGNFVIIENSHQAESFTQSIAPNIVAFKHPTNKSVPFHVNQFCVIAAFIIFVLEFMLLIFVTKPIP